MLPSKKKNPTYADIVRPRATEFIMVTHRLQRHVIRSTNASST